MLLIFSCLLAIFLSLFSSSRTFSPSALSPTFSHRSLSSFLSLCSGLSASILSFLFANTSSAAFGSLGSACRFFLTLVPSDAAAPLAARRAVVLKSSVEKEREDSGAGAFSAGSGAGTTEVGGATTRAVGAGVGRALGAGGVACGNAWVSLVSAKDEGENAPWTSSSVAPRRLLRPRCEAP